MSLIFALIQHKCLLYQGFIFLVTFHYPFYIDILFFSEILNNAEKADT